MVIIETLVPELIGVLTKTIWFLIWLSVGTFQLLLVVPWVVRQLKFGTWKTIISGPQKTIKTPEPYNRMLFKKKLYVPEILTTEKSLADYLADVAEARQNLSPQEKPTPTKETPTLSL